MTREQKKQKQMKAYYLITIRDSSSRIQFQDVEGHPNRERAQLSALHTAENHVPNWADISVKLHVDSPDKGYRRILI